MSEGVYVRMFLHARMCIVFLVYIHVCIYTCMSLILYTHYIHIYIYIGYIPSEGAVDSGLVQHRQNRLIRGTGLGSEL